jgi:hypothetical protein
MSRLPAPIDDRGPIPSSTASPELTELLRSQPPACLDELVRARVSDVLAKRRAELDAQPFDAAPHSLGSAEVCAYACGFFAYAAQVADGLAHSIWRAMLG